MTPDQIDRVERLVERIVRDDAFATAFYNRLFEAAPETQTMFPDVDAQRTKLRDELKVLVALLRAVMYTFFAVGLVWCAVSPRRRSVQDILVGTSVIYDWRHHG